MDSQPVEDPIEMAIDSPGRKTLVLGESDSDCDTGFDPQPIPAPTHDYFQGTFFCWILQFWVDNQKH